MFLREKKKIVHVIQDKRTRVHMIQDKSSDCERTASTR